MLDQIGSHLLNQFIGVLHVLRHVIALHLILFPEANDDTCGTLADDGTTTVPSQLCNGSLFILVGQHELCIAHSDTSLAWLSVTIASTESACNLAHCNIFRRAVHLLLGVLVICKVNIICTTLGPERTVMTIECRSAANVGLFPLVSIIIELVQNLVRILLPRVLCHCLLLI